MDQMIPDRHVPPGAARIVIGLVNSMPGEARQHTERQFGGILRAAAYGRPVELRCFSFNTAPGDDADPTAAPYDDTAALPEAPPDGLIVTGMPPRAARLADEPYWPKLTRLVDFVVATGLPTVWSCLAAHAAVEYLDGIARQRLPRKLSGVVDCTRTDIEHPLVDGLPRHWRVPHSRYNDLPGEALRARGYRILSRTRDGGVDVFTRDEQATFLFCQGHPEYEAHTLLREYRRDIRQFLHGERDDYPEAPQGCFGAEVTARLDAFRAAAERERRGDMLAAFPMDACAAELHHGWGVIAGGLCANWLAGVADRKRRRSQPSRSVPGHAGARGQVKQPDQERIA